MDMLTLIKLALLSSIMLVVLSFGMGTSLKEATAFLRQPALAGKAMLSMFLILPLFVLLMVALFPLKPAVVFTLLALAVSPMPPVYPGKAQQQGGGDSYVMGLFVLATAVSLIAAPILLTLDEYLLGMPFPFEMLPVLRTLILTIAAPLAVGLFIAERFPAVADKLRPPAAALGKGLLLVSALALLLGSWKAMRTAVGDGTLLAIFAMVIVGLASGYLLGGPGKGNRAALATATALRHPGVALPLAAAAAVPTDRPAVLGTVLLYLLVNVVAGGILNRRLQA
ncbi:hypothetical protein L6Q21_08850 [Sandaracinobacter sp. RS1-74]|uniref:hypothetical protein n=1 Tax=Sandaracinobacteroides sayramensis TaxID=2913411 RepID=UPI001ED9D337|nr:hypothetical protein [Sandaracinobacteroides sayramensis]MCG2841087.1 hypothetical protein [Sandaracinobacteroides sayramensis]